jgi:hypothetical protein
MNMVVREINAAGIYAKLTEVQKNNLTKIGVTIGDGTVRPTMYFTEEFDGMTSKEIAKLMIERYENLLPKIPEFDPNKIMTRDYIKEHVHTKLVPYSDYVTGKAYKKFVDLYKLFYIETPIDDGYITLTTQHLELAGVTVDELEAWAEDSYEVSEMIPQMLILSNETKFNGAAAITNKAVLDLACNKLGAEMIYILPSSVHEVLAVAMGDPDELKQMVCEVNDTRVVPQERLSYNVYKYERGGELEIA